MTTIQKYQMLSIEETQNIKPVSVHKDIYWLPEGSHIDIVLFDKDKFCLPHESLVSHAFSIPFLNKNIILTNHVHRGLQILGGHKEKGEDQFFCVKRESYEEGGVKLNSHLVSLGYARIFVPGDKPEKSKYPHPYSVMSFFGNQVTYQDLNQPTAPITECYGISILDINFVLNHVHDIGDIDKTFIKHYKINI